eukprot:TRINITY_DN3853_c0_g3_i1.p1 TRINITY_DN3853_c0_g3~~TRINITY_DN3853_c0_g3_i1.p1  ORF type:complete len:151 (+),score=24.79 TRINITY_DN3853_c0_g3_i1:138-590(+)
MEEEGSIVVGCGGEAGVAGVGNSCGKSSIPLSLPRVLQTMNTSVHTILELLVPPAEYSPRNTSVLPDDDVEHYEMVFFEAASKLEQQLVGVKQSEMTRSESAMLRAEIMLLRKELEARNQCLTHLQPRITQWEDTFCMLASVEAEMPVAT